MQNRSEIVTRPLRHRHGFTLVELLIVMAILGLLSAILFTAFSAVRNRAYQSTCASNLKQLGKALELYAQDHRGLYPPGRYFVAANGGTCAWGERIYPYLRSTAVFKCPAHPQGEFRTGCPAPELTPDSSSHMHYRGSYALNMMEREIAVNQTRLRNPSGSVLVAGNDEQGFFSTLSSVGVVSINGPEDLIRRGLSPRHGRGDNLLFADGHVKWMSLESMAQKGENLWSTSGVS